MVERELSGECGALVPNALHEQTLQVLDSGQRGGHHLVEVGLRSVQRIPFCVI